MFDEREFGTGLKLTEVNLIHERANEEDAATGAAEEILRCEWIGKVLPVDSFALIGKSKDQRFAIILEAGRYLLRRIVVVAMKNSVYGCLADGHGDAESLVLVDSGLRG